MKSHFIESMTQLFRSRPCPKGLIEGWHQLEQAVATAVDQRKWQIIQWPTGTGKTEALTGLCAGPGLECHPAALIVTKFTEEASTVAIRINDRAGLHIALAAHGKAPATIQAMTESPVLVTAFFMTLFIAKGMRRISSANFPAFRFMLTSGNGRNGERS
ncbi:hypothetical protein ACVIGB_006122 [Bradyrhizobium sp. USDA 4341]